MIGTGVGDYEEKNGNRTWIATCGCVGTSGAGAYETFGSGLAIEPCPQHDDENPDCMETSTIYKLTHAGNLFIPYFLLHGKKFFCNRWKQLDLAVLPATEQEIFAKFLIDKGLAKPASKEAENEFSYYAAA